jgi:type IX secretion system PorP/SprF family membrane protein
MNKVLKMSFFLLAFRSHLNAQDPQYSQFYHNQLSHNPAFTGHTSGSRFILTNRMQWVGIGQPFRTYALSFDTHINDNVGSVGLQVVHDQQATSFQTTSASLFYAKWIQFGENGGLTAGFKGGFINHSVNLEGLKFIDQYSASGINAQSIDPLSLARGNTLTQFDTDVSVGLMYEKHAELGSAVFDPNKTGLQVGLALHHVDKMLRGQSYNLSSPHWGLHGTYKMPINLFWWEQETYDESTLSFTGYIRKQGQNMMLDIGTTIRYSPVIVGVWYRGLPIRKYNDTPQQDALVALLGYESAKLKLGLSYDITITSLSWKSGGTIELTAWIGLGRVNFTGTKTATSPKPNCEKFRRYRPW